ncbi:MAG: anaerobic ribonucleoside-triphosphate reductase activating protein [Clostridia bacterium]|jgi:anaerobic ribonucleoside-triphosphate reductase activating protein|nr:anaerobic ribonucleoside-triphosphate reductase activating protein [Clostridia bacterium]
MRLAGIIPESVVDGPGVRFVVFAQGCPHHCSGCHNPQTWDLDGGEEKTVREIRKMLRKRKSKIRGLTISGGEPFLQAVEMAELAREAKKMDLDVVTYTGYLYEDLLNMEMPGVKELLEVTDLLIDGPFRQELKDIALPFRGSSNQRLIDLAAMRQQNKSMLTEH